MIELDLFFRFLLVGMVAFGGGQAALPLVERVSVAEHGWVSPTEFGAAVAFGYVTPGPVLITATFIGYHTAGLGGALSATVGVFLIPWVLAALAAEQIQRFARSPWLRAFGKGAAPAVIGLLGITLVSLGREAVTAWPYTVVAGAAAGLSCLTKLNPMRILLGGCGVGAILSAVV
jgi:chromate transporter